MWPPSGVLMLWTNSYTWWSSHCSNIVQHSYTWWSSHRSIIVQHSNEIRMKLTLWAKRCVFCIKDDGLLYVLSHSFYILRFWTIAGLLKKMDFWLAEIAWWFLSWKIFAQLQTLSNFAQNPKKPVSSGGFRLVFRNFYHICAEQRQSRTPWKWTRSWPPRNGSDGTRRRETAWRSWRLYLRNTRLNCKGGEKVA